MEDITATKKKGLGRDIENSLEMMEILAGNLKEFAHSPLKKGLVSLKVDDEKLFKMVNEASEEAFGLINKIHDIRNAVKNINMYKSSRFAADRVISKFLKGDA